MSTEEHVATSGSVDEYESAADQALCESLGYMEVIGAITDALLGDWDDSTLH